MVNEPPEVSLPHVQPLTEAPPNHLQQHHVTRPKTTSRPTPAPRSIRGQPGQQYSRQHQQHRLEQLQREQDIRSREEAARRAEEAKQKEEKKRADRMAALDRQQALNRQQAVQRRSTEEVERPMYMNTQLRPTPYQPTVPTPPQPTGGNSPAATANNANNNQNKYVPKVNTPNDGAAGGAPPAMGLTAQAMALSEREAGNKIRVLLQSGKLKDRSGKHAEAVKDFYEALEYEKRCHGENSAEVANTHAVIGKVYHKMGRHNDARKELEESLRIFQVIGYTAAANPDSLWTIHDSLAQVYDGLKNRSKEIEHYETAIRILTQSTSVPPERLPHMHNNVGNAYRASGNLNKAVEHLERSKEMMLMMHYGDASEDMAKVHSSLGDVYKDLGRHKDAIRELEDSIRIRQRLRPGSDGDLIRGSTHQTLATLYEALGNTEKANYHKEKSQSGLQGLMGSKEDRESLMQKLGGVVKGQSASGVLGKLAAGLTASDDINKAQQFQAENDSVSAIKYYEKGIASLMQLPDDIRNQEELLSTLALCHNNVGNAYRKTNQFAKAEENLRKALDIRRQLFADESTDDTASTLFNLGHLLQGIGGRHNTQRAIEYHEECLRMYHELGGIALHMNWIISLYRSLGVGYERLGNSRKSIENYEFAKTILVDSAGDLDELRAVCNNMGNSYESIGDYEKAKENIETALNLSLVLAEERPNDVDLQNHIAAGHNNLGVLYQTWGKLELALEHLYKSKDLREKIKDDNMEAYHDVASSYHNIGNTLIKMGNYQGALDNYKKELRIRLNLGEDTSGVRVAMSNVCEKLGDMQTAEQLVNDTYVLEEEV
ncbi:hypothetical protein EB796_006533 [Bugula neritina]|uniref:TTC28 n=1 Tax=Bugula neritina TaxID=10212 RepID=A0A7J7K953_BUGNE|nr:hypothetical protein EB796_006533 [Bugula neritina]